MKIQKIHFIKNIISSCTDCSFPLKAYKLDAAYRNIDNSKITANLLTDVLFCERCARGYLLEAFRITTDQHGKLWIALEPAAPVKVIKSKSPAAVPAPKIPNDNRIVVNEIQGILSKGAECITCKRGLLKKKIILMIKTYDGQRELEERTRAFFCSPCSKWFLTKDSYATIKNKYKTYIIPVKTTISITGANQPKPAKPQKQLPKPKMIERDTKAVTRKSTVRQHPVNSSFDRTGRFIHSDATKRWKDYNSD